MSDIPLIATLYLLIRFIYAAVNDDLLADRLIGHVNIYSDGRVETQTKHYQCQRALLIFSDLFIILTLNRRWYFIWRDSLDDEQYWQLLQILKKEP